MDTVASKTSEAFAKDNEGESQNKKDREFRSGTVQIRDRTLILNDRQHYQISNISSFELISITTEYTPKKPWGRVILCVIGAVVALACLYEMYFGYTHQTMREPLDNRMIFTAVFIIFFLSELLFIAMLLRLLYDRGGGGKKWLIEYGLNITMNSGDRATFVSMNKSEIEEMMKVLFRIIDPSEKPAYVFNLNGSVLTNGPVTGNINNINS